MEASIYQVLVAVFLRSLGFFSVLPIPLNITGLSIRVALASALSLFYCTLIPPCGTLSLLGSFTQLLVGLSLSLPLLLFVSAVSGIGECLDAFRGQTLAAMYDLSGSSPLSVSSALLRHYGWAFLLIVGGAEANAQVIGESFSTIPLNFLAPEEIVVNAQRMISLSVLSLKHMVLVVLPLGICCILVEGIGGLIGRIASGLNVYGESFQIKSFLSLLSIYGLVRVGVLENFQTFIYSLQQSIVSF
ncbi:MAG: flagellar biosynthetic protein FliR [SAR324 cluster bacterium]|uniref:Flagellar biosynthetic protein FliR n=1 Tax=SAR324 cluster bacterium TaxID=2024889 RepID=A0A7X9ILH1_9DELT|nr:flagellar biosynthetic protein FliR [SAR324 cluster bacterium]